MKILRPYLRVLFILIFFISRGGFVFARGTGFLDYLTEKNSQNFKKLFPTQGDPRLFKIKNSQNKIFVDTEIEKERRKLGASETTSERSRLLFKETFETGFQGSIYHPKFMNFDLLMQISPQQNKEKSDIASTNQNFQESYLTSYNVVTNFLQAKPLNFSIYGDKKRDIHNYQFFERQTTDGLTYGTRVNYRSLNCPLSLNYSSSSENIDRTFRSAEEREDQRIDVQASPVFNDRLGKTDVGYTQHKFLYQQGGATDQKGAENDVNLANNFYLDESKKKNLSSSWRYRSLTGDRDSQDLSLNENLTVDHAEHLKTSYSYNFSDKTAESTGTRENELEFNLNHQLYESLFSSLNLLTRSTDSTSFDENQRKASIKEDYQKAIGLADLDFGIGYAYEYRDRKSFDSILNVTDESLALTDSQTNLLKETDVDISTIVITDSGGIVTYVRDIDYQIISNSNGQVEIRRIVSGQISNNQTVLVDYLVRSNPSFDYSSAEKTMGFGLSFFERALKFYTNRKLQDFLSGENERTVILRDVDETIYGVEWRKDLLNFVVEYQDYETDYSPFDSLRINVNTLWPISTISSLRLDAIQNYVNLPEEDRENYEIRGEYSLRLSRSASCNAEVGHRWQNGLGIDLKDFISRLNYRAYIGKFFFEIGYEYEREKSLNDLLLDHYVYTKFKRDF